MYAPSSVSKDSPQHQALMQLARAQTVQEAEQLLAEMCLNQRSRVSTLDAMIQQIQQNGIHPSSACCSAIVTAFVDAGLLDRAKTYLQYIKAQHKDLPLRTYNVLIDAFGKAQDFQTMEELYELLLAEGITPNVITYNTMLFAYGKAGRFAKLDNLFNSMLQDPPGKGGGGPDGPNATRDVTTFITLMDAHGRAGHIEQMEIYHRAMLAAGHKPSLKVYNALLSAYGKAQDIEQMTYYVNKMEANGIPPNTGSYNILIGVFGKMGKIDVMEQFYTALRQSGLTPDVFTYNSMLAAYGKALNEQKIQETWQEMLACGVQPNVATYQNAIEAYSRLGHINMMEAMYHEAMQKGLQLGVWAYSSLLAAYCNAGDTVKVEATFESMALHKVHPNVRCFSSVIKAHAKAGDVETMERRFRQLMASPGNRPDLEIFVTIIKAYGPKYADRAINTFLAMKPSRVMPTLAACYSVLEACSEIQDAKELRRLWAHIPAFCKDNHCCKLYTDLMAKLGESDDLLLDGKDAPEGVPAQQPAAMAKAPRPRRAGGRGGGAPPFEDNPPMDHVNGPLGFFPPQGVPPHNHNAHAPPPNPPPNNSASFLHPEPPPHHGPPAGPSLGPQFFLPNEQSLKPLPLRPSPFQPPAPRSYGPGMPPYPGPPTPQQTSLDSQGQQQQQQPRTQSTGLPLQSYAGGGGGGNHGQQPVLQWSPQPAFAPPMKDTGPNWPGGTEPPWPLSNSNLGPVTTSTLPFLLPSQPPLPPLFQQLQVQQHDLQLRQRLQQQELEQQQQKQLQLLQQLQLQQQQQLEQDHQMQMQHQEVQNYHRQPSPPPPPVFPPQLPPPPSHHHHQHPYMPDKQQPHQHFFMQHSSAPALPPKPQAPPTRRPPRSRQASDSPVTALPAHGPGEGAGPPFQAGPHPPMWREAPEGLGVPTHPAFQQFLALQPQSNPPQPQNPEPLWDPVYEPHDVPQGQGSISYRHQHPPQQAHNQNNFVPVNSPFPPQQHQQPLQQGPPPLNPECEPQIRNGLFPQPFAVPHAPGGPNVPASNHSRPASLGPQGTPPGVDEESNSEGASLSSPQD